MTVSACHNKQSMVSVVVYLAFETYHELGGLVLIQVGLAKPRKVRGGNVTTRR
jgi:hypothetical protein